jgi:pyruvate-ferredoxin/flavodoxin oxidoreductase
VAPRLQAVNIICSDYYGAEDADRVIIAMGSVTEAAREVIDYLRAKGEKVGLVSVHLYRPFSAKHFLAAVPKQLRRLLYLTEQKNRVLPANLFTLM